MDMKKTVSGFFVAVLTLSLIKLAFFPSIGNVDIIPSAHAEGAVIEWKESRIISTGSNGEVVYIWDFKNKTQVRKYSIRDNKLRLQIYDMNE